ncbi:hypothetical protein RDABS01_035882 [Bienertia sinuspersici]
MWMNEVLTGNPIRCVNAFQMQPDLFLRFSKDLSSRYGLKPSCKMSIREKIGIFFICACSRAIHDVLNSIASRKVKGLAHDIIRPYDQDFKSIPAKIATDKRYMPYFKAIRDDIAKSLRRARRHN